MAHDPVPLLKMIWNHLQTPGHLGKDSVNSSKDHEAEKGFTAPYNHSDAKLPIPFAGKYMASVILSTLDPYGPLSDPTPGFCCSVSWPAVMHLCTSIFQGQATQYRVSRKRDKCQAGKKACFK